MMNRQEIIALLQEKININNIRQDEQMKGHTTFRIGGPADLFVTPATEEELIHALKVCRKQQVPFYVIGNGSNLLVSDEGFRGVIIEVYKQLSAIEVQGNKIVAQAGALLSRVANVALEQGLTGFEFAHGIPGTLGGAVTMNAGAYDGEMSMVLEWATIIDQSGELRTLTKEQLELGYRTSIVQKEHYTVVKAGISLQPGDKIAIQEKMKDFMGRRRDKQPLEFPSAGSTFKRPVGHFAGKLIMDSGLQGHQMGGAQVSAKHCGFVINAGEATCKDVLTLIKYVQEQVYKQFNVKIETEIKMLG